MTYVDESALRHLGEPVGRKAPSRRALIAVAALLVTVTNAVAFMLPPLLPLIAVSYAHNSLSAATWIFTMATLGGGAGFVLIPRLTDMLSDRATALMSGGFLTSGALIAGIFNNYPALLVGSILMGFGCAAQLVPLSFLRRHLPGDAVSIAVRVVIMATGTGVVLGMVGGGASVRLWPLPRALHADGSLPHQSLAPFFFILAGLFVLTTVALLVVVPNGAPQWKGKVGVGGTVWLIAWVALVLLPLSAPPESAVGKNAGLVLVIGLLGAAGWAWSQRRSKAPVFDLDVLRKPFVTTACLSAGLFGAVDASFLVLSSYFIQNPNFAGQQTAAGSHVGWPTSIGTYGLGYDPLKASLILLPFALTMFISGKYAEKIVIQGRPALVLLVGAAICCAGLVFLTVAHDQPWHYVVGSGLVGLGSRAGYSGAFAVPQLVAPEEKAGMVAGMPGTVMAIGFALGAAVVTLLQLGSGFTYHSQDVAKLVAGQIKPSAIDLRTSDFLLDGTHFSLASAYTWGYLVTLAFPLLIILSCAVSRARNENGFKMVLEETWGDFLKEPDATADA